MGLLGGGKWKSGVARVLGAGREENNAKGFEGGFEFFPCWGCSLGVGSEIRVCEDELGGGREENIAEDFEGGFEFFPCWGCSLGVGREIRVCEDDLGGGREEKTDDWGFGRDEKREEDLEEREILGLVWG